MSSKWSILDLLYPPTCVLCREVPGRGEAEQKRFRETGLCADCSAEGYRREEERLSLILSKEEVPMKGDAPMKGEAPFTGKAPIKGDAPIKGAACFRYEGRVKEALMELKYKGMKTHADSFAAWMLDSPVIAALCEEADLITSVPVSKKRRRERGYNQAELIGRGLSGRTNKPYEELLLRVKETRLQKELDLRGRDANMAGAFEVCPDFEEKIQRVQTVLLVDDIITTGSTLCECAGAILLKEPRLAVTFAAFSHEN